MTTRMICSYTGFGVLLLTIGALGLGLSTNNTTFSGSGTLTEAEMAAIHGTQTQDCICQNTAIANGPCQRPDECNQCKEANGSAPAPCSTPRKDFTNEAIQKITDANHDTGMRTPKNQTEDPEAYDYVECYYARECVTPEEELDIRCDGSGECNTMAMGWQCIKCSFNPMDEGGVGHELNVTCLSCDPYGS